MVYYFVKPLVIISGTALIGSIYFLLRQQDNLTIVNVRPCAVITANSEYVIQELHIEIKSLRDQIYLNKVFVSDPFSPFCTLFKIKTKNPTLIKRKKKGQFLWSDREIKYGHLLIRRSCLP